MGDTCLVFVDDIVRISSDCALLFAFVAFLLARLSFFCSSLIALAVFSHAGVAGSLRFSDFEVDALLGVSVGTVLTR